MDSELASIDSDNLAMRVSSSPKACRKSGILAWALAALTCAAWMLARAADT
jgi:hypothetical protein